MCICFVDLEKAFDRVTWDKLISILKDKGIDWKERRIIWNLYRGQRISIKVGKEETEEVEISRGVRQGCPMSPILFNIYLEDMIIEHLEGRGVHIGGRSIRCIRFADDMALLAEDEEDLQGMVTNLEEGCIK